MIIILSMCGFFYRREEGIRVGKGRGGIGEVKRGQKMGGGVVGVSAKIPENIT